MKKLLVIGIIATAFFASCGGKTGNTATNDSMPATTSAPVAQVKYQCPMKCEGEKTYDKPGNCPVCQMPMKEVK